MRRSIMVDMDEVITEGGFLYLINEYLGTNYTKEDVEGYYMQDLVPDKDEFFKYFISKNMYDYGILLPNVKDVLEELQKYYDIYIGTSYIIPELPRESSMILKYKHEFLYDNLPFIKSENYIFITNKSLLDCDIKIDDKLDNLKNAKIKLLFESYHNKGLSDDYLKSVGVVRVHNWLEIKDILEGIDESSSSKK